MAATAGDCEIVLALNSGSSSLKFGVYEVGPATISILVDDEIEIEGALPPSFDAIDRRLDAAGAPRPTAIGHRIVHGGPELRQHCLIDADVEAKLEDAIKFAPLHGPAALALVRAARAHVPQLPQVACFDTAFHATLPGVAYVLPIPKRLRAEGLRRYGFHGLSCESIVRQLGDDVPDRLIVAHLGNGASITAIKAGRSIDTSMGLTPSGGVVMGSRSGDIDPGVLIHLARGHGLDAAAIERLIDHDSGLLGISGISSDMRHLHTAALANPDAALAIAIFCYSVRKQIAAMIAVLEGVDLLVFTGGIGEHDDIVRATICDGLRWAGLGGGSAAMVRTLPSREDEQIARHAFGIVRATVS